MLQAYRDATIRTKLVLAFLVIALITALVGVLGVYYTNQVGDEGTHIGAALAPRSDAAMEIKLNAYIGHLLLEEILAGDTTEDIDDVWSYFKESVWYCDAILSGGTNQEGTFLATDDERVRAKISSVKRNLQDFIGQAEERYEQRKDSVTSGSQSDQDFDKLYIRIQNSLENLIENGNRDGNLNTVYLASEARYRLANSHLFLEELLSGDTSNEMRDIIGQFEEAREQITQIGGMPALANDVTRFIELSEERYDNSQQTSRAGSEVDQAFDRVFESFIAEADDAETMIHDRMEEGFATLSAHQRQASIWMFVFTFLGFVAAIGLGLFIARMITQPLTRVVDLADEISEGDLSRRVVIDRKDETGQLAEAMKRMMQYMQEIANVAQKIAVGDVEVNVSPRSDRDVLNQSFVQTISYIQEVADVARQVAVGNVHVSVVPRSDRDVLNHSFAETIDYFKDIATVAETVSKGDLRVEITPKSEQDLLSNAFATMLVNLRNIIVRLTEATESIASTAEELAASSQQISRGAEEQSSATEETSASMEQMASSIQQVASNSESLSANVDETSSSIQQMTTSIQSVAQNTAELSASVEQTSSTIEEMAASIEQVAVNTGEASNSSQSAVKQAQDGSVAMTETVNGMEEIASTMERIVTVIEKLNDSSKEISRIVDVIDDIAEQTNLLALNAAIEAARAGEHGRGFAVVADEVRKLAERSASSAREIVDLISSVQTDTESTIGITRQGSEKVERGMNLARQTGDVLSGIVQSIETANRMMQEISKATNQQARASEQVVKTVENMQRMTQHVDSATKEQASGSQQIVKAVDMMNRMARQMSTATTEQKRVGEQIVRASENVAKIATQNVQASKQINLVTNNLNQQADGLRKLAASFTI